jgi:hypothetical protein
VAKLAASIRAIRKDMPGMLIFPEKLKQEAAALITAGMTAAKIAAACGLAEKTITRWGIRYSEVPKTEAPRMLTVVAERQNQSILGNDHKTVMCEIDIGCSVVVRIPMESLTRDFLRGLREAFQPC